MSKKPHPQRDEEQKKRTRKKKSKQTITRAVPHIPLSEANPGKLDALDQLVVVNSAQTAEEDLMSDLVSIITSFVARLYGRRRAKRKTDQVLAALQENGSNGE